MNRARRQAGVPRHWAVLRGVELAFRQARGAIGAETWSVPPPRAVRKIVKNTSKIVGFACSRTVPENLLTGVPSICKNERGHEVTFWPFRPDEPSSNPAESCWLNFLRALTCLLRACKLRKPWTTT